ncbi:hypothetical protein ASD37_27320 [Mycobacterium sp. Root135]|uniref:hypothetical protein n=1 Tax=Mycobacterium sp. Root135 TaxID=1736457 RepID=UPI0006F8F21C|nr:hypothetical protein [Mycobacterium sp. Root135]KQY03207.1 hypothetical protein ASD37_27320 [Mycobacterium sp. Root135]
MPISAVNTFRLRSGVTAEQFERFSADLDRPTCLAFDVVLGFEVYLVDGADGASEATGDVTGASADVVEIMTVSSWPEWERVRDSSPELKPVVQRFDELVEPGSVATLLTRKTTLPQEI